MVVRNFIFWLSNNKTVTGAIARNGMRYGFARRFVAGQTLEEALAASSELNRSGFSVSLNHLGEYVRTSEEALAARDGYLEMLRNLHTNGVVGNVSIKLTQLGLGLNREVCRRLAEEIASAARDTGSSIEIDMEDSPYTQATLEVFEAVRRRSDNVGLAIQAYLYRSAKDLEGLATLRPKIRLVKGAYREPGSVAFQKKSEVDANYLRMLDQLLAGPFFPAIATHDPKIIDYARRQLRERGFTTDRYEFQMIYGVRRDLQRELHEQGHPLRIYVPFGTEWCPYFMRRLAERPANCWFVLRSLAAEAFR